MFDMFRALRFCYCYDSMGQKKVDLIFFDAGGGHRAAATALQQVLEQQQRPWTLRLLNLQDILDPLDVVRKATGLRIQDFYNNLLKSGWTLGSAQLLRAMHAVVRLYHKEEVRLLREFWESGPPDMVVSLVPNFNRALRQAFRELRPAGPYVTILTDLADFPPHFWIERQEQYLICGTEKALQQALHMGHSRERVFLVSGMILRPQFYRPVAVDREAERLRLKLDPNLPTGLVMFGGQGSRVMTEIARRVEKCRRPVQLIFICGRNERLAESLRRRRTTYPFFVEGFTTEIPYYMHLSDYVIGKPGPGSISEALAMKLPVIVERNAWTMPQERYNADWVLEQQVGLVIPSFREIHQAVDELLEPERLARCRANAARLDNRAVFEISDILAGLLR